MTITCNASATAKCWVSENFFLKSPLNRFFWEHEARADGAVWHRALYFSSTIT